MQDAKDISIAAFDFLFMNKTESTGLAGLPDYFPPAPSKRTLREILDDRLSLLKEAIEELETLIRERVTLTERFKSQIEEEINEVLHQLSFLPPPWKQGFLPEIESLRQKLHHSLTARKEDKRAHELKEWEHVITLLKERRKLLMEWEMLKRTTDRLVSKDS